MLCKLLGSQQAFQCDDLNMFMHLCFSVPLHQGWGTRSLCEHLIWSASEFSLSKLSTTIRQKKTPRQVDIHIL